MKKPQRLRPKDKVAIVSLSSGMMGEEAFLHKYTLAKQRLEQDYGLEVVTMPNALKGQAYLYQHPEARAADWMQAFADPEIKAIFNAIGGDDAIRLLPYIDDKIIAQNPKDLYRVFRYDRQPLHDVSGRHRLLLWLVRHESAGRICRNQSLYPQGHRYHADAPSSTLHDSGQSFCQL